MDTIYLLPLPLPPSCPICLRPAKPKHNSPGCVELELTSDSGALHSTDKQDLISWVLQQQHPDNGGYSKHPSSIHSFASPRLADSRVAPVPCRTVQYRIPVFKIQFIVLKTADSIPFLWSRPTSGRVYSTGLECLSLQ